MKKFRRNYFYLLPVIAAIAWQSCDRQDAHLFTKIDGNSSGIHFKNVLQESETANALTYTYFYNGGGVAVGDINNDGLTDILFTGNMSPNRLYLNKGNFEFEDITEQSGVAKKQGWCTGASMVDINGDGRLDIYICRSADTDPSRRKNLLYINNGDLTFTEEAEQYGLADQGYSTQASFFDYDKDGDLDMFLANHSLQQYATGAYEDISLRKKDNPSFSCKLYRNDNGHFSDVSKTAGILSNVLSFGLSVLVSDMNNDNWPDIYVSNDFDEPDYLFINNRDGTFSEKLDSCMDEVSLYSMGSDCADYNNDGYTDLLTLDMLPEGNHAQKMHSGAENFNKFRMLFNAGYYYQYSRNMLHTNNADGTFSETGQLAGISNTDWSWAALFADFDNDGYKDIFITNGYEKDYTDMDFIKYKVDRLVKQRNGEPAQTTKEILDRMPSVQLPNYIFQNTGKDSFANRIIDWGFTRNTVSSGAAYADLDNDGDMDLIVSNINDEAGIYRNNSDKLNKENHYLKIKLNGNTGNNNGAGAKVKLFCNGQLFFQEQMPVRGFQSSVDPVLNFGIGKNTQADSLIIVWPDDKQQLIRDIKADQLLSLNWKDASLATRVDALTIPPFLDDTLLVSFKHQENDFNDFTVQTLLPGYLSRQGPCIAVADINNDGLGDIFIGGAKGQPSAIFIQSKDGRFLQKAAPAVAKDSLSEDVAAVFFDADNDGDNDLYVASGGYEFAENDSLLQDRLYFNDGKGNFIKNAGALPVKLISTGVVKAADIDGDGDIDLFVGGRVVPGKYPLSPPSCILLNNGKGIFTDDTDNIVPELKNAGMVTDAAWADINNDGKKDLIIAGEWMPVKVFISDNKRLIDQSAKWIRFASSGWWNRLYVEDMDGDGDEDIILGNCGINTQFKVSDKEPLSLYYGDFDRNGSIDPLLCYYINGVSYPAASRDDLTDQLPGLKKKFLAYNSYANAQITDILSPAGLETAGPLKAETMESVYLENRGEEGFVKRELPVQAQYAPVYAIAVADVNDDGKKDIILAGNNQWTRIKFGRYRANHGVVLAGDGKGNFQYVPQTWSGLNLRDDIRSVAVVTVKKKKSLVFGINNGLVKTYLLK